MVALVLGFLKLKALKYVAGRLVARNQSAARQRVELHFRIQDRAAILYVAARRIVPVGKAVCAVNVRSKHKPQQKFHHITLHISKL